MKDSRIAKRDDDNPVVFVWFYRRALHTLIESYRECTINKIMSLVYPFSCVSPTFLPTTIYPPTDLISHCRGKIYIHSIKFYHK
jgi:hypothetical protein